MRIPTADHPITLYCKQGNGWVSWYALVHMGGGFIVRTPARPFAEQALELAADLLEDEGRDNDAADTDGACE